MPRRAAGRTAALVSQPKIDVFTERVTRRSARIKNSTLDSENENIRSIAAPTKKVLMASPKRPNQKLSVSGGSPTKMAKKEELLKNHETIQQTYAKQLELLKSPSKLGTLTPDKLKFELDLSPEAEKPLPSIVRSRRALAFDDESSGSAVLPSSFLPEVQAPVFSGSQIKRAREVDSQPNSPSTASPMYKKQLAPRMSAKEVMSSPKKPSSPRASPRKVDGRSRAERMLEAAGGDVKIGGKSISKELLKRQIEKSGKLNEIKERLKSIKTADDKLQAIRDGKIKAENLKILRKERPKPTPTPENAPCYMRFRHLVEPGRMTRMTLPTSYEILAKQFEAGDNTCATMFNRGQAIVFEKIAQAVRTIHGHAFDLAELSQIRSLYPEAYKYEWRKGLYDAKSGSGRVKSTAYQLTLHPLLENDENESAGAKRMSLAHINARYKLVRKTLFGIVFELHKKFLETIGAPVDKMKQITRWHPSFPLESCEPIKKTELPAKPGSTGGPTTAAQLLHFMKDQLPEKASEKLKERKAELEKIELKKILEEKEAKKDEEQPSSSKPGTSSGRREIPPHILAKIRAKQAAKAEQVCSQTVEKEAESNLLTEIPKAASTIRSHFIAEKKNAFPFDTACKHLKRSWKSAISIQQAGKLLEKIFELKPEFLEIKTVVGTKYCKLKSRDIPVSIFDELVKEKMASLAK